MVNVRAPLPCGVRCATSPSSGGCWNCAWSVSSVTACSRRGSRGRSCSTPSAPRRRWRSPAPSPCSILPYSLLGPFAGALLDRWDRRLVLVGANFGRLLLVFVVAALLQVGADDLAILVAALIVNGFTPLRLVRPVGGAAACGAAGSSGGDELGRDRGGGRGRGPRRRLHARAPLAVRRRRHRRRDNHLDRRGPGADRPVAVVALSAAPARPGRQRARDPRVGRLRGGHRVGTRRSAPSRRCRRWPRRWPGWPRTGWCSASTPCWCS